MKATHYNYRQTPRKTRLVTEMVKGKSVVEALTALKFLDKRAAGAVAKLIASAAANAEKQGEDVKTLFVQNITVDKGIVMKRSMARAFGRSAPIRHRMSHLSVTLGKGKKSRSQRRNKKTGAVKSQVKK